MFVVIWLLKVMQNRAKYLNPAVLSHQIYWIIPISCENIVFWGLFKTVSHPELTKAGNVWEKIVADAKNVLGKWLGISFWYHKNYCQTTSIIIVPQRPTLCVGFLLSEYIQQQKSEDSEITFYYCFSYCLMDLMFNGQNDPC